MTRKIRVQRFGHITYVGAAYRGRDVLSTSYQELFTDSDLVTPTGKFRYMSSQPLKYSLTMLAGIPPIEVLAFAQRDGLNQPVRLLPGTSTPQRRISILSSSFTPQFREALASLFDLRGGGMLLTTTVGLWDVSLDFDGEAPAFEESLDGTTGPVSIAVYCRGLSQFEQSIGSEQESFGGVVNTSRGTYRFLMIRIAGVWIECLERLAESDD